MIEVGTVVRIERDETKYPSKGTWPQFRGRTGTVVEFNLGEIAIGKTLPASGRRGGNMAGNAVTWFRPYELAVIESRIAGAVAAPSGTQSASRPADTREVLTHV